MRPIAATGQTTNDLTTIKSPSQILDPAYTEAVQRSQKKSIFITFQGNATVMNNHNAYTGMMDDILLSQISWIINVRNYSATFDFIGIIVSIVWDFICFV